MVNDNLQWKLAIVMKIQTYSVLTSTLENPFVVFSGKHLQFNEMKNFYLKAPSYLV